MKFTLPTTQSQLFKAVRGEKSQTEIAAEIGVTRSSWCRYENEVLGAPTTVLNYCLRIVSAQFLDQRAQSPIDSALMYAQGAVNELRKISKASEDLKQNRRANAKQGQTQRRARAP